MKPSTGRTSPESPAARDSSQALALIDHGTNLRCESGERATRFQYLRDPLFLASIAIYGVARFIVRPLWPQLAVVRSYLNDLICIPLWLPILLFLYRKVGLRRHDALPQPGEVLTLWVVWSIWFEVIAPLLPPFRGRTVADPWDVAAYGWGALAAMLFWHRKAMWTSRCRSAQR